MYLPVNSQNIGNMNWSIVVIGAIIVLPGIYWVTHARHVYIKEGTVLEDAPVMVDGIAKIQTGTVAEEKR